MGLTLRKFAAFAGVMLLSACVLGGGKPDKGEANPITGDMIEVTPLDAPAAVKAPAKPAAKPGAVSKVPQGAPPDAPASAKPAPEKPIADPKAPVKPRKDPQPKPEEAAPPLPEAMPPVPQEQKSEAQLACEKSGSMWSRFGGGSAATCVKHTKDSGKRCKTGKQCDGECLARSGSCAPFKPLLGCNEIIQDNGVRSTLCID